MGNMKKFVKPPALEKGAVVGVIAPSDAIEKRNISRGIRVLESWGLKTKLGQHLFSKVGDFAAGSASERREDILKMISDPEVRAIWAAEGGYAATEVLPVFTKEVVEKLQQKPKWFIGYSDVCVLLNALASFRLATIHGPNLSGLPDWNLTSKNWLKRMLFGERIPCIGSEADWKTIIPGEAQGVLLVSNLDSLAATLGTKFDPLMHGTEEVILGLEEWWIEKSTLQRQIDIILNHKRSKRIRGIILGRFVGVGEQSYPRWGKRLTVETLVEGRIRLRNGIPLAKLPDFGHPRSHARAGRVFSFRHKPETFLSLPNGIKVKLTLDAGSGRLQFLEPITG